ncbi:MAG: EamA family transporter [Bryobacteraceae bacterium]|nr:EamA family transporter [Bryobacteraceae bacterium]MDW8379013.1 EamA family transporter [Bryobacterales bacterium]
MKWLLVLTIVAATVASDLLQSREMKRQGEIQDFRPGALGRLFVRLFRRRMLILAVACMAISFFAFLALLRIADLSFAAPATAATYVVETLLAKVLLKENVSWQRWTGACLVAGGVGLLAW